MCETCGCGNTGEVHPHPHYDPEPEKRRIDLNLGILSENARLAERNREFFQENGIFCLNLVSSPGSGKTTILEKTISELIRDRKISVIEGDQQTELDAERIRNAGAPAVQINTGSGCHLDAKMIHSALKSMIIENDSLLFIENVGNLVCPALFDLGERKRVLVMSVTEGEDKPLKYPYMFRFSHLCLLNKTDLSPYTDFSEEKFLGYARQVNPDLEFILLSAKSGEGMKEWYEWILKQL